MMVAIYNGEFVIGSSTVDGVSKLMISLFKSFVHLVGCLFYL